MIHIRVEYVMEKSAEDAFDALTDHENYQNYPGFTSSALLEAGKPERNGLGALRQLVGGGATFKERITAFERPVKMSYHCEQVKPIPFRHDRGDIILEPMGDRTRVIWISEGQVRIPLLGPFLDRVMERRVSRAFLGVLKHIEKIPGSF